MRRRADGGCEGERYQNWCWHGQEVIPVPRPETEEGRPMIKEVPFGTCWCGCGLSTKLAQKTERSRGWVKGEPIHFISGHNNRVRPPSTGVKAGSPRLLPCGGGSRRSWPCRGTRSAGPGSPL